MKLVPWCTLVAALICSLIYVAVPFDSELFHYATLRSGDLFSLLGLIGGHLAHTDLNHLFWNLATLGVLGFLIEERSWKLWLLTLVASVVVIDIWFFLQNQFQQYAGLSGVLNGFFVVALYCLAKPGAWFKGNLLLWMILAAVLIKNIYEYVSGTALLSDTRWPSAPTFHLAGMLAGVLVCLIWTYKRP